jgi:transcriptional regulator with XRE-family HTH domain
MESTKPKPHLGRRVSRMRELLGIKQEVLATKLGTTQQAVSRLEQNETIDDERMDQIAKALGVTSDAIRNFDEEKMVMNIQNNYEGANQGATKIQENSNDNYHQCTFNPLDKLMEALEENKRLYEALLKEKEERIKLLEQRK